MTDLNSNMSYIEKLTERVPFFDSYENSRLFRTAEYRMLCAERTYKFSDIPGLDINGFPECIVRNSKGELEITFTKEDSHVLFTGATRSGKTTGFVIPFLNIMPLKRNKPHIAISDPKRELLAATGKVFEDNGYRIIHLDLLDYTNSDCWNPLTKIFKSYKDYLAVEESVGAVELDGRYYNTFKGEVFKSRVALESAIEEEKDCILTKVDEMGSSIANFISPVEKMDDPFWDQACATFIQAFLWAMLEDSDPNSELGHPLITEDTFSFNTLLDLYDMMLDDGDDGIDDHGYFTNRNPETSKAYKLASNNIIRLRAKITRTCITSVFQTRMKKFRDSSIRRITRLNTIDLTTLDDDDRPTAIFISFKDEDAIYYDIIGLFLTDLYTSLIASARSKGGKLSRPFYFLLDEFGNFPKFNNFSHVISACGSRNIWFMLIIQSYAQLYEVYGKTTADTILDNLNMHVYFGSCNYETKRAFSQECGTKTVLSPAAALNGRSEHIDAHFTDQVPLIPISKLDELETGECIITRMRHPVVWSRLERSYTCPEYDGAKKELTYDPTEIKFADYKYKYDLSFLTK